MSGGKGGGCVGPIVWKSGRLNLLEPSGLVKRLLYILHINKFLEERVVQCGIRNQLDVT